jgi:hypothetical protein
VLRRGLAWFILAGVLASFVWLGVSDSEEAPDAWLVLFLLLSLATVALCIAVIVATEGGRRFGDRALTHGIVLIPLVGLVVMGEWLGLALVLAASPATGDWLERRGWPGWVELAVRAISAGAILEGFLTVFEDDTYDLLAVPIIAVLVVGVVLLSRLWDMLRSRGKPSHP